MRYAELLPTLLAKGHCVTRPGKPSPTPLPPRFRQDLTCEFHQGAQGHDVEGCYALKYVVKDLMDRGRLTFENSVPHVLDNPLPNHGAVNMIEAVRERQAAGWGKVIQILENKRKEGLGFTPTSGVSTGTFHSAGFINAIVEDTAGSSGAPVFVTPGGTVRNWEAVDVPLVMHASM
jgi:hypothetical protein